jgi:hypothetical protein
MSIPVKDILSGWTNQKGFKTKKDAAKALGYDWSKIHNWFSGHPCPDDECPKLLEALGCETIREANLKYALPDEQLVEVYPDFNSEAASTASAHLHGAKIVRETRIMLQADPLLRPDKLRLKVAGLLQERKIKMLKLEQICSRDRAVELVCNVKTYDSEHYIVGLLPYRPPGTNGAVLYENFAVFADELGDRSVMAVWLHATGPDLDIPYISAFGRQYAAVYRAAWETMWRTAERMSGLSYSRTLDIVSNHLRAVGMTAAPAELNALAEERMQLAKEIPPRY